MKFVFDSNIFVSLFDPKDLHHQECEGLLESIYRGRIKVVSPVIVLGETICAIARRVNDSGFSHRLLRNLTKIRSIHWEDCTQEIVEKACLLGIESGLKGADSIVLETARTHGLPLLTQDKEILSRCPDSIKVMPPGELLLDQ
jgi:predicted nucleic acid-binding protein